MEPTPSLETTLRTLVAEIAIGNYRDPLGHQLVLNTAYIEAVAMLELGDAIGAKPPTR